MKILLLFNRRKEAKYKLWFGELRHSIIKDRVICGIKDQQQRDILLCEDNIHLNRCVNMCQAAVLHTDENTR